MIWAERRLRQAAGQGAGQAAGQETSQAAGERQERQSQQRHTLQHQSLQHAKPLRWREVFGTTRLFGATRRQGVLRGLRKTGSGFVALAVAAVIASALALPFPAFAQDATWEGNIDDDYNNADNWDTGTVPGAGNTATFNGATPFNINITSVDNLTIGGWSIDGGNYEFNTAGGSIQFGGAGIAVIDGSVKIIVEDDVSLVGLAPLFFLDRPKRERRRSRSAARTVLAWTFLVSPVSVTRAARPTLRSTTLVAS
ncbi:MAG: hypothetical protein AAGF48_11665 [Pseudomonadota bacterium]